MIDKSVLLVTAAISFVFTTAIFATQYYRKQQPQSKKEKKAQKEQNEEKVEKAADGSEAVKQNLPVIQKATTVIENRIPTLASHIDEQNLLKHKEVSPQVESELAANEINPSLNKKNRLFKLLFRKNQKKISLKKMMINQKKN